MNRDADNARTNGQLTFLHNSARPRDRNWNYWNLGFDGHDESALLKSLEASIRAARPLGKDQKRMSCLERLGRSVHRFTRLFTVLPVHRDEAAQPHGATDDRHSEELLFRHHKKGRKNWNNRRRIAIALMIGREDRRAAVRNVSKPPHIELHTRKSQSDPRSQHANPIKSVGVSRQNSEDQKRRPDE